MRKKKYDPIKEIECECEILRSTPKKWISYRDDGGSDPFWPDGANMNLLRNHMIYAKREIEKLCQEYGIIQPKELLIPIPPYVDNNYFAFPNSARAERILQFRRCCNQNRPCNLRKMKRYSGNQPPKYSQLQMFYRKDD